MEEDIKILEDNIKYFKDKKLLGLMLYHDEFVAIEHLISSYKKLEEENKVLRENAKHNDKVVDDIRYENMELKQRIIEYSGLVKPLPNFYDYYDVIPKQNIRNMIEKIDNYGNAKHVKELCYRMKNGEWINKGNAIELLQELLEKGNK